MNIYDSDYIPPIKKKRMYQPCSKALKNCVFRKSSRRVSLQVVEGLMPLLEMSQHLTLARKWNMLQ